MAEPNAAEVLEQDGPETQINAEVPIIADPKDGEVDPQAIPNDVDANGHKRLGGWQRKIEKLKLQNEQLVQALLKREVGGNADTKAQNAEPQEDKAPVKPIRPKVKDFATWDDYDAAADKHDTDLAAFHEANLAFKLRQAETGREQRSERQKVADGFASQVAEARKDNADFDEVAFNEDTPMTDAVMQAIVTSEFGAKIAYELGKNPAEAERISKLPPVAAIREIGKIESRISGTKSAAETTETEPEPAAASRAPRPPVPVRRATAVSNEPLDTDDPKTWLRKREAQLAARHGR